ncbi:outer membrane protein assembly factor BamE domain-containing protein [Stenotrophomonas maltophilia]|uniref:outer membrane protein assembly factor BamE domain-containing protein n=2 Tax=Lysobacteraceae TaxID=32033 RepID=UPI0018ED8445|nr:outer membrane protein assembly factor BamE [Stenotrophomonas maltophilia]
MGSLPLASKKRMKRILIICLAIYLLAGCASAGHNFSFNDARKIQTGMSEQEVIRLLGPPSMVTTKGDTQVWVWSYATAGALSVSSKSVSAVFQDGVVREVPNIPSSFK